MRPASAIRQPIGRAFAAVAALAVWRRRGFVRPLSAVLVLALIGGGVMVARSLLDLGAAGAHGGWPAAATDRKPLGDSGVGSDLEPLWRGPALPPGELEAALAQLKHGAFGVTFEAVVIERLTDRPRGQAAIAAAAGSLAPIVSIDAANPPLRIDIMGLEDFGAIDPGKGTGLAAPGGAP